MSRAGSFIKEIIADLKRDFRSDRNQMTRDFLGDTPVRAAADANVADWYEQVANRRGPVVSTSYLMIHLFLLVIPLAVAISFELVELNFPLVLIWQSIKIYGCGILLAEFFGYWSVIRAVKIATLLNMIVAYLMFPTLLADIKAVKWDRDLANYEEFVIVCVMVGVYLSERLRQYSRRCSVFLPQRTGEHEF